MWSNACAGGDVTWTPPTDWELGEWERLFRRGSARQLGVEPTAMKYEGIDARLLERLGNYVFMRVTFVAT